jgi:hypothetical protein
MKTIKHDGPGRPPTYDWEDWFGRKKFLLRRGRHFSCMTFSMASRIRTMAGVHGVKVSIRFLSDDSLVVTVKKGGSNGRR